MNHKAEFPQKPPVANGSRVTSRRKMASARVGLQRRRFRAQVNAGHPLSAVRPGFRFCSSSDVRQEEKRTSLEVSFESSRKYILAK
jgi:hypothetical protein